MMDYYHELMLSETNHNGNKWHTPKNVNRNKKEIPMIEDICG